MNYIFKIRTFLILVLCVLCGFFARSQSLEYNIKASMIGKIAQNTIWENLPENNLFTIAVVGKSPFNGELEKMASRIKINNRLVRIKYINKYTDAAGCQVLFVCASERKKLSQITSFFVTKNTLLISDSPDFAYNGIHFNFYKEMDSTIHFEINLNSMKKYGLKPNLQLLMLGRIIN